jgi:hypothetical protein
MGFGSPRRDELVAPRLWEREIGEAVAVDVAKLDAAEPELHSPETMRMLRDTIPGRNHLVDTATGVHTRFNAGRSNLFLNYMAGGAGGGLVA